MSVNSKSILERIGFTDVSEIGEGTFGKIYTLRDVVTHKQLVAKARKLNDEIARKRWSREVEFHRRVDGIEGIPRFLGAYEYTDSSFLFMSHISGARSLNEAFQTECDPRLAAEIVSKAALIIHECHKRGVLHRDISVYNILRSDDGQVWVVDFGLGYEPEAPRVTGSLQRGLGTPGFASPELCRERKPRFELDERTDVFSLGRVLLWLCRDRQHEWLQRPLGTSDDEQPNPVATEGIDDALLEIIRKATVEYRDDRFSDAKALAGTLAKWLEGKNTSKFVGCWRDRLNDCFGATEPTKGEAAILHFYPEVDQRPSVLYDAFDGPGEMAVEENTVADENEMPRDGKPLEWWNENCKTLAINDSHVVLLGQPDWSKNLLTRITFYRELSYWRYRVKEAKQPVDKLPPVLSANVLLFCETERCLLLHLRSKMSATYGSNQDGKKKQYLHTFGGSFMPAFGTQPARDDSNDLLLNAIRECFEESRLAPKFAQDTPALMCRELQTNFHQLMTFSRPVSFWEYDHVCPQGRGQKDMQSWEGKIFPIRFDELESALIDPTQMWGDNVAWVPTGRLHVLAWLAMGAPLLHPDKKQFNGMTPWEVFWSVTEKLQEQHRFSTTD